MNYCVNTFHSNFSCNHLIIAWYRPKYSSGIKIHLCFEMLQAPSNTWKRRHIFVLISFWRHTTRYKPIEIDWKYHGASMFLPLKSWKAKKRRKVSNLSLFQPFSRSNPPISSTISPKISKILTRFAKVWTALWNFVFCSWMHKASAQLKHSCIEITYSHLVQFDWNKRTEKIAVSLAGHPWQNWT